MERVWFVIALLIVLIVFCLVYLYPKPKENDDPRKRLPYQVYQVDSILSADECDRLLQVASRYLQPSKVNSASQEISNIRTSMQAWLEPGDPDVGAIVQKIRSVASALTGVFDEQAFESLQVARYEPSQEYREHYDACVSKTICQGKERLYRRATVIVYLSDDFEGGETFFPKMDTRIVPRKGAGVLFYNTDPDTGLELLESLHAGLPVKKGTKWIANQWIRYQPKE